MNQICFPYTIRWARVEEWEPAMKMIWRTFLRFEASDYTQEGIDNFLNFITDDKLFHSFLRGDYQMMVALDREQVVGAASVRNRNHLSLLFVDEAYHMQGIGRNLMERFCSYLKDEAGEQYMSLKAAPYAVNFYRKIGFQIVRPEEEVGGIRVTSMEKYF
ncbi:MAG: GNAT family N-acetyltransferase [Butyrivibrio sp.]|nr:GNAT family N-acetyltransferase [Muribaculum sp.]MCM1551260.1 GNAT family N-acetyltransferase [Butyrivibrio sp.]